MVRRVTRGLARTTRGKGAARGDQGGVVTVVAVVASPQEYFWKEKPCNSLPSGHRHHSHHGDLDLAPSGRPQATTSHHRMGPFGVKGVPGGSWPVRDAAGSPANTRPLPVVCTFRRARADGLCIPAWCSSAVGAQW